MEEKKQTEQSLGKDQIKQSIGLIEAARRATE